MSEIKMRDVSAKSVTLREAKASALLIADKETVKLIKNNKIPKGDVLAVAQIAGIQAAKNTKAMIPLCHPVNITDVKIDFILGSDSIEIISTVKAYDRTGVEMEALSSVALAALSIYDMCKSLDREMYIREIKLLYKSGGKSGVFIRNK